MIDINIKVYIKGGVGLLSTSPLKSKSLSSNKIPFCIISTSFYTIYGMFSLPLYLQFGHTCLLCD